LTIGQKNDILISVKYARRENR
jgi:hypothetical protein